MKKLGKKRASQRETVQAYACLCTVCACPKCANETVSSMLYDGQLGQNSGTLLLIG